MLEGRRATNEGQPCGSRCQLSATWHVERKKKLSGAMSPGPVRHRTPSENSLLLLEHVRQQVALLSETWPKILAIN
jgi:hypothetical protein